MDTSLLAQALRVGAAWIALATATTCTVLDRLADRLDPPGLDDVYAGFDTRLCDLPPARKAEGMLADADGYFTQVRAERQAEAWEGRG